MKKTTGFYIMLALLLGLTSLVVGQPAQLSVVVTPEKAALEPGQGLHFEAQLFDDQGHALDFSDFSWHLKPDSLAEMSEDGYFIAGEAAGEVRVIASMARGGIRYSGEAVVFIGRDEPPAIKILVTPQEALIPPGGSQRFHVAAIARNNANFSIDQIRWAVEPERLAKISPDGLLQAGDQPGQGVVIAYVNIGDQVYRGAANITISPHPAGAISGKVSDDQTGDPLIGAEVLVQRLALDHVRWMRIVRTDSTGNYAAHRLIPGLYVVKANAHGYLSEYYLDANTLAEATAVQVTDADSVTGIDLALGHGGSISGLVAAEVDSTPIPHARVIAIHVTTSERRHTLTDENGQFELSSLAAGDYVVFVDAAGYEPEYYEDARGILGARLLHVVPPAGIENVDVYLGSSSAIAGKVVDAATETPIARADVQIFTLIGRRLHARFHTKTDANGEYIAGVPPGFYLVHVEAHGYQGQFYDHVTNFAEATPVQVLEGQHTTGIDFSLASLGHISGLVTDAATGLPLADAVVLAFQDRPTFLPTTDVSVDAANAHFRPFQARTDADGKYVIESLPAGKYFVLAEARGYLPEFYQEAATLHDATPVEVTNGSTSEGIDFTLSAGGSIAGTVYDAGTEAPLAGALVSLWSTERGVRKQAFTDENGAYVVPGLPDGDYVLFAKLRGYDGKFYDGVDSREEATPVTVAGGASVSGIDFKLPKFNTRLGTIAGVVTAESDSSSPLQAVPLAGAVVVAIPITPGAAHFDITDPFGNYRITNLVPGEYIVLAWAPHYIAEYYDNVHNWRNATPVAAAANEVTEGINFALAEGSRGPYRLRGIARKAHGQDRQALQNAVIVVFNDNGIVASAVTEPTGEFVIDDLPSGDYKLKVDGYGAETAFYGGATEQEALSVSLVDGNTTQNLEINAPEATTGVEEGGQAMPESFQLLQNYPNPFNPETSISFAVATKSRVKLQIYNVLGQAVRTLVDKELPAGTYEMQWNGTDDAGTSVASGVYLLRFEARDVVQTRRMVLTR